MERWLKVEVGTFWVSEDRDSGGETKSLHTVKVDDECEDLKAEAEKKLKEKKIHYDNILDMDFM
jgi:hypothetical protein